MARAGAIFRVIRSDASRKACPV